MSEPSSLETIRSHNDMARASLGAGWDEYASEAERDREDLLVKVGSLRKEIERMQEQSERGGEKITRLHTRLAKAAEKRDRYSELLNEFAYAVAPISVIGDHTPDNDPWANALEMVTPAIEVQKMQAKLEFLQSPPSSTDQEYLDRVKEVLDEQFAEAFQQGYTAEKLAAIAFQTVRNVVWSSEREMKKMFGMARIVSDLALEERATAQRDREEIARLNAELERFRPWTPPLTWSIDKITDYMTRRGWVANETGGQTIWVSPGGDSFTVPNPEGPFEKARETTAMIYLMGRIADVEGRGLLDVAADIAATSAEPQPATPEPEGDEEALGVMDAAAAMLVELAGSVEAEMPVNSYFYGDGYGSGMRGGLGGAGGELAAVFDPAVARKLAYLLQVAQHRGGGVAVAASEVAQALLTASATGDG